MPTKFESREGGKFLRAAGKSRGLLVMFRGLRARAVAGAWRFSADPFEKLAHFLNEQLEDVDILLLDGLQGSFWSWQRPETIAALNIAAIDEACRNQDYKDVRFLCYSMGAALARKTLIGAYGEDVCGVPFERAFNPPGSDRDWPLKVSRLVSVAGYARGWIANPRMSVTTRLAMNVFGFVGHVAQMLQPMRGGGDAAVPLAFRFRRGSPFITNTRLQWLGLMQRREKQEVNVSVLHVMPANDTLVSIVEVIDIEAESDDQPKRVHYITVPDSDHGSVLDIKKQMLTLTPRTLSRRKASDLQLTRGDYLLSALCGKLDSDISRGPFALAGAEEPTSPAVATPVHYLDDSVATKPDDYVERFAFIIHGIRDTGAWAKKIGAELHRQNQALSPDHMGSSNLKTDTQSYGYFTAFPFLFPWVRRQKVEWLMDRYATARALYPKAKVSFFGHSNGTYLGAAALRDYETCSFDRMVMAGSVVREDFDWESVKGRVGPVVNYVATGDAVVALFPNGIKQIFGTFFDLGAAGHAGFDNEAQVQNVCYAVGSHGAGITEHTWSRSASFLLGGDAPLAEPIDGKRFAASQQSAIAVLGRCAFAVLILGAIIALSLGWALAEPLLGLWAWSPLTWALDGLGLLLGGDTTFNRWATGLDAFWQSYAQWSKLAQAAALVAYGWLVRFFLFRF